jgi:hypothetical protein
MSLEVEEYPTRRVKLSDLQNTSNIKVKKVRDLRSSGMLRSVDFSVSQALKTCTKFKASGAKFPFVYCYIHT